MHAALSRRIQVCGLQVRKEKETLSFRSLKPGLQNIIKGQKRKEGLPASYNATNPANASSSLHKRTCGSHDLCLLYLRRLIRGHENDLKFSPALLCTDGGAYFITVEFDRCLLGVMKLPGRKVELFFFHNYSTVSGKNQREFLKCTVGIRVLRVLNNVPKYIFE